MDDLISRQAAIDAIGNYLKKDGDQIVIADVVDAAVAIGQLPSAQPEIIFEDLRKYCEKRHLVILTREFYDEMKRTLQSVQPEIIRCKDCKHASPNGKYGCKAYHFKQYEVHEMYADDFCSRAERV